MDGFCPAVASGRPFSVLHPTFGGEIRRLGHVETRVESAVVAKRKSDHDLALFLRDLEGKQVFHSRTFSKMV